MLPDYPSIEGLIHPWKCRELAGNRYSDAINCRQVTNIEKPNAQIYYKKLLEDTKIEATWNLVRYKVRHLRTGWQKANAFSKSTGAGVEEGDSENTVRGNCPLWTSDNAVADQESSLEAPFFVEFVDSSGLNDSNSTELSFVANTSMKAQKTSVGQLVAIESSRSKFGGSEDRSKIDRESLNLQVDQFLWSKKIEERKLKLEEARKEMDERKLLLEERHMDLKEKQVENEFKLKQQELEQKERILKLEL
ncbi:hypothetical protein ACLKA6_008012 [Drosophila palustris]